ncbi:hypothetical protein D3C78_1424610 [compost metagenome]
MIWETTSSAATSGALNFSPRDAPPIPKNIENTTICRISLLAIAPAMLVGMVCDRNAFSDIPLTASPVSTDSKGIARFRPLPGCSSVTMNNPTRMESTEELINHTIALPPTRPMVEVSPSLMIPTVRVLNTRGAITILMRRRKISVRSVMLSAQVAMALADAYS